MSTPYDTSYRLPFPALMVVLRNYDKSVGPFLALLDSGSDATLVPVHLLEALGAAESGWVGLRTHFGQRQRAQRYLISLQVADVLLPGVYVVNDDTGDEIILGRDVLNKIPLFLDGPAQQTEVLDDTTVSRLRARRD